MTLEFQLGDQVSFRRTLSREYQDLGRRWYLSGRKWVSHIHPEKSGLIMGVRSLADGVVRDLGEDGSVFVSENRFRAYLISYDMYRKPVLVLPEHISLERKTND